MTARSEHRCVPLLALLVAGLGLGLAAPPDPKSPEFPRYVMRKIDDMYRGTKSHARMQMKVHTKHWTRTMRLEAWALERAYTLVRILAPKKERGNATLKAKDTLFTYLSKTGRTVKITSALMGGSWMGSHFTNDDLVQGSRLSRDYSLRVTFAGMESGTKVYRFALIPKKSAAVVWGKIEVTVRQSDLQPLRQRFYDEDGKPVREMRLSKHRKMGGRLIPTEMEMKPLDGSGEYTRITYEAIDFSVDLERSFFSLRKLRSL